MKVAIVGSRDWPHPDRVKNYVRGLPAGTVIVSGGATGVDTVAELEAKRRGLEVYILLPDWNRHGKRAGAIRNQMIVDAADRVVAFWDGISRGTKITIDMARCAGKPLDVYMPEIDQ